MTNCIIFDFDGTLVNSEYINNYALREMFQQYGIYYDVHVSVQRYKGFKLARIIAEIEKDNGIKVEKDFVDQYRALVEAYYNEHLEPMPQVICALEAIELPVCIASSAPKKKIIHGLEVTGLSGYFNQQAVFSSYEINSWKPEPKIFSHVVLSMGFNAENCLVVDDAEIGIRAALAANMRACYYNLDGQRFSEKNVVSISHMPDLLKVLS